MANDGTIVVADTPGWQLWDKPTSLDGKLKEMTCRVTVDGKLSDAQAVDAVETQYASK